PPGAAIQQAGPAARADPLAGGSGRRAELPRRAELQRGRTARQGRVRDPQEHLRAGAQEAGGGDRGMTSALNPKYSFDSFVVGAANRLAVTAGHTVAESPGAAYNPLFIYSGSGLGKTHLLMAVGHAAKKAAPKLNIEYLTLDEYVEAFHASVAAGQGDAFRRRFQNVDVLLVDDVQFLTNRKEMQSELLRLTEALQAAGRQIVLTSDRPPPDIADLDERLISRLSGGLVVDMGTPDYETRVAILRRKSEERGVPHAAARGAAPARRPRGGGRSDRCVRRGRGAPQGARGGGGRAGSTGRGPERISRPRAVERGGGRCGEGASGRRAAAGAVR